MARHGTAGRTGEQEGAGAGFRGVAIRAPDATKRQGNCPGPPALPCILWENDGGKLQVAVLQGYEQGKWQRCAMDVQLE